MSRFGAMRVIKSPFFICRSAGVFNLALPLPAVLSAELQTILEPTTAHTRVPKMLMGML
jgi:hypothetical protein